MIVKPMTVTALVVSALWLTPALTSGDEPDPFRHLRLKTPIDQLPPLRSVRVRRPEERLDPTRRKRIVVKISTSPAGARVYHGRRRLGVTPLALRVPEDSTPLDIVLRAKGFMTLRTRIQRDVKRNYVFKLTPSKFR
jgi:hypothetical protein